MVKNEKLVNIAKISAGQGAPQGETCYCIDGLPFIKAGNLEDLLISNDEYKSCQLVNEEIVKKYKLKLFPKDTIVFAKSGMSAKIGRIHLLTTDAYIVNHLAAITPKFEFVIPKYLKYFFNVSPPSRLIKDDSYPSIGLADIEKISTPLPPLEDQKRIVKILDTADALRQKRKLAITLLDDYIKSFFLDMFGDPVSNPKGWETKTIEYLVKKEKHSIKRGPFGGSLKKEIFVDHGYLVYEQYHALNNDFSMARYFINEEKFQELKAFEVKAADIIISCSGVYLGKLAIVPKSCKKGIINQALLKLTLDQSKMNNLFFVSVFSNKNFGNKYFGNKIGSGIPNFPPISEFKKFKFISPPLELQKKYADIVQKSETLKQSMLLQSAELDSQFQFLMQKFFHDEL